MWNGGLVNGGGTGLGGAVPRLSKVPSAALPDCFKKK